MDLRKKQIGKRIKLIRKNTGLTQEQLSELIGLEVGSLSGIETGRYFPSLDTLYKIANALNVDLKTFFDTGENISITEMRKIIANNIYKISDNQIPNIYKYFEGYK